MKEYRNYFKKETAVTYESSVEKEEKKETKKENPTKVIVDKNVSLKEE